MKRLVTFAGLVLVFAAMFGLYELSYRVDRQEERLRHLTGRIAEEKRSIAVLRAEWAYLTRPAAVQDRAISRLDMQPALPGQLVAFRDVPERQQRLIISADMSGGAGTEAAVLPDGERLPLPRPRPSMRITVAAMSADDEDDMRQAGMAARTEQPGRAVADAAPSQAVPRVEPRVEPRTAPRAGVAPARDAAPLRPRAVEVAARQSAPAAGARLLPADMEARLLKVAAQQLSGGGAVQALMEGQ